MDEKIPNTLAEAKSLVEGVKTNTSEACHYVRDIVGNSKLTTGHLAFFFLVIEELNQGRVITMKGAGDILGKASPYISKAYTSFGDEIDKPLLDKKGDNENRHTDRMYLTPYGEKVAATAIAIAAGKARYSSRKRQVVAKK